MATSTFSEIPLSSIRTSETTAQIARRMSFDKEALQELAASITVDGVLQAIVVRPLVPRKGPRDEYELVAGERRFLAANIAGLERIPANVRELSDEQVVRVQLVENLQKEDLHPMHEAESYNELMHQHGVPLEQLMAEIRKSKGYIYGRMKLLSLSPKCRKAFYAGELAASIAEKIARIPTHALQEEALEAVLGFPHAKEAWKRRDPMSYRHACDHINEHFMLDLTQAPFPVDDVDLNGAGACGVCPKRSGNQPELFADVKKGDTCTDTACFSAKARAFGQRQLEEAKKTGQKTIVGGAAKKISPHGVDHYIGDGYTRLASKRYHGGDNVPVAKLLKPDAEIALLQDPKTGRVIEVVHESQLKKAKREQSVDESKYRTERKEQAAVAKRQKALRRAVFDALVAKGKWPAPPLRVIAELIAESVDYEAGEALMQALGIVENKSRGFFGRLEHYVKGLKTDAELQTFIAQAYLAGELHVNSYRISRTFPRLEAAAKAARIDVAKIKRDLAPKKKARETMRARRKARGAK
jgi:ParB/RepB/Spo0J family partition protein